MAALVPAPPPAATVPAPPPAATVPTPPPAATVPAPPPAATVPAPPPAATVPTPPPAATVPAPPPAATVHESKFSVSSGTFQVTTSNSYQPMLPPVPPPATKLSSSQAPASAATPPVPGPQTTVETQAVATVTVTPPSVVPVSPAQISVVPPVVWYNKQVHHVVVSPLSAAPLQVVRTLRAKHNKAHNFKPSMQPFPNRFLWQPAPSENVAAQEPWRGVYWQHVDVHRYVARRYCGNPPPIE